MQISSGTPSMGASSLQMLKAQQAWEARRATKTEPAKSQPVAAPKVEIETSSIPSAMPTGLASPWENTVREVQDIASQAGFLDVTEQDIRRAYMRGESLLADYRV
ncbi:MAG TPA: hypothetical protein V6C52_05835 [Coleofasciculaceae cyanobacterium]|jgi:hypothetical protein